MDSAMWVAIICGIASILAAISTGIFNIWANKKHNKLIFSKRDYKYFWNSFDTLEKSEKNQENTRKLERLESNLVDIIEHANLYTEHSKKLIFKLFRKLDGYSAVHITIR